MTGKDESVARILALAAAEGTSASEWLRLDEYGGWARTATEFLAAAAAQYPDASVASVEREIADRLVVFALRAMLADERARQTQADVSAQEAADWRRACQHLRLSSAERRASSRNQR